METLKIIAEISNRLTELNNVVSKVKFLMPRKRYEKYLITNCALRYLLVRLLDKVGPDNTQQADRKRNLHQRLQDRYAR